MPPSNKVVSLSEAVRDHVDDGARVALEGFTHLIPFAAGHRDHPASASSGSASTG